MKQISMLVCQEHDGRGYVYTTRRIGGQRLTPECSPIDSCTPAPREAQAESTGERQQSTHRSEDTRRLCLC
ncbi:unnamed protein product [Caretta caretta]